MYAGVSSTKGASAVTQDTAQGFRRRMETEQFRVAVRVG